MDVVAVKSGLFDGVDTPAAHGSAGGGGGSSSVVFVLLSTAAERDVNGWVIKKINTGTGTHR